MLTWFSLHSSATHPPSVRSTTSYASTARRSTSFSRLRTSRACTTPCCPVIQIKASRRWSVCLPWSPVVKLRRESVLEAGAQQRHSCMLLTQLPLVLLRRQSRQWSMPLFSLEHLANRRIWFPRIIHVAPSPQLHATHSRRLCHRRWLDGGCWCKRLKESASQGEWRLLHHTNHQLTRIFFNNELTLLKENFK